MNILFYCDEYPPARNGGIGTVVKLVAEAMSRRGHKVVVVGKYWDGEEKKTVEYINGVTVLRWHRGSYKTLPIRLCNLIGSRKSKLWKAQLILRRTQRLLEKEALQNDIDLVELPDYVDDFMHFDGLRMPKWRVDVPRIIRVHGSVSFLLHYLNGQSNETKIQQDKAFFAQGDAICAVSSFSKEYVEKYIQPQKAVDVIYNPIRDSWFENLPDFKMSQTILYFGRISEMKGVHSLIRAFNQIAEAYPNVKLRLVGGGDIDQASSLVASAIKNRVEFAGFVSPERIKDEIDGALFCVLPSYFENFSMAALEVLARRKALIYTSRASGRELIEDSVNGLLVDPDDVEQLAEKIQLLLSDENLRSRLAICGYETCRKRFSTEVIIPQMELYYEQLIEKCKA